MWQALHPVPYLVSVSGELVLPPLSWWLPGEHWLGTTGAAIAITRDGDVLLHIMPGRVVAAASALHALCAMLSTASVV